MPEEQRDPASAELEKTGVRPAVLRGKCAGGNRR